MKVFGKNRNVMKLKLKKDGFGEPDADTTLEQVLARIKQQNNQPQTGAEDQAKQ